MPKRSLEGPRSLNRDPFRDSAKEKVHELAQSVAVARLVILNLQPEGRQVVKSREAELSCLVSFICRQLSFTSVKGRVQ